MSETFGALLADISRLMRRNFDARARAIGVTRAQWHTLKVLARREGIKQTQLADHLEVEPITLSRMVDRLVESGMVERRPDPADRRAWLIYLTPASRPLLEHLRVIGDQVIEEALDGLGDFDRGQLMAMLETIRVNLNNEKNEAANG